MKFLGDRWCGDRHARPVHIINEEIEKQEDRDKKTLALQQRCDSLVLRFRGRSSSPYLLNPSGTGHNEASPLFPTRRTAVDAE